MISLKSNELETIQGGCFCNSFLISKIIHLWRYIKVSKLVTKVFET